jgi:putative addiction module component (TIGR02574 family)
MTQALARILNDVKQLSVPERAELADKLAESLAGEIPPEIERAQLEEVRRRIASADRGQTLIPGSEALAQVRKLFEDLSRRTD